MLFNTLPYLLFLPIAIIGFYATPARFRWIWLSVASSVFLLFAGWWFWAVAMAISLLTWGCGRAMATDRPKLAFWVGIGANIVALSFFKFHSLLPRAGETVADWLGNSNPIPEMEYLLPLGISYYVFQGISYLIDIRRKTIEPEFHAGRFLAYMLFFPKLLAGPIERASKFLPQISKSIKVDYYNLSFGARLVLWGLFKKMVIADRLDPITDQAFYFVDDFSGFGVLIGLVLYPIQLYADFSGYTDIALGSARMMGIRLSPNFNRPFAAISVTDFWRRWHISLSSWVRDYLFTPLSLVLTMQRGWGRPGTWMALLVAFVVLGIWHGPYLTFLVFGLVQGVALAFELATKSPREKMQNTLGTGLSQALGILATFGFFAVSCLFFRAPSLDFAATMLGNLFAETAVHSAFLEMHANWHQFGITLALTSVFLFADHVVFRQGFEMWCSGKRFSVRWLAYCILLFSLLTLSGIEPGSFVYNDF